MSLADYSSLQTAVAAHLKRSDLTTLIPDWITLAEEQMSSEIKSRSMETRTSLTCTPGNEIVALPSDMVEMRRLLLSSTTPQYALKYATPDEIKADYPDQLAGWPVVFTVIGTNLQLAPTPDSAYTLELAYLQRIPALSNSNTTNWVLTNYPGIYYYGTLIQAATFLRGEKVLEINLPVYRDHYGRGVSAVNAVDWYSGSTMTVRAR